VTNLRIPPGRAGRLRLQRNLAAAVRGADLLEQKLRVLRTRHEQLQQAEAAAATAWDARLREAETWLLRGLVLGGEQALSAASGPVRAEATVEWTASMGVPHPAGCTVRIPARSPDSAAPGNTALVHAETAYREAVAAAGAYAAAQAATRILAAEVAGTRQRVRALRRHWIPQLEEALGRIGLALEQNEHEDAVRRRWAAARGTPHHGSRDTD
jgi:vacuolar-type H+-ATPase subunit D/Vma8